MHKFIYVLIGTLTVFSFWYAGRILQRNGILFFRRKYWKVASLPIFFFCVFYGLRFGRLVDYNVYAERYDILGRNTIYGNYEPLFRYAVHYMSSLHIPYWIFILLCSFSFVLALFKYLKLEQHRLAMPFIFMLAFFTSGGIEQLIRWYLGAVFFLLALSYLRDKKFIFFIVLSIVSCFFHFGFIILVPFSLLLLYDKSIMSSKICLTLFLFSIFVGTTQMLLPYLEYLNFMSINDKAERYVEGMERLLSGGYHAGIQEKQLIGNIRDAFMYSFPLIIGHRLIEKKLISHSLYNIYKIAIIVYPIFVKVEILDRYAQVLMIMSVPLICGNAFSYLFRHFFEQKVLEQAVGIISLLGFLQTFFWKNLLSRDEWFKMLFIWDAEGRDALPINYFINF